MAKYICKNPSCQKAFNYCRACLFKPIYYHDAGYCSEKCLIEDRTGKKETVVEPPVMEIKSEKTKAVKKEPIAEEIIEVIEPKNEIPAIEQNIEEEDTSSFSTEECVSDKDTETAPTE